MINQPHFRTELLRILAVLSEIEAQKTEWGIEAPTGNGAFTVAMHFLLDDTQLADMPSIEIGHILESQDEAQTIKRVTDSILNLFRKMGNNLDAEQYVSHPDWVIVVETAKEALAVFKK